MDHTKLVQVDLDSPRQELSDGGLGIVVHSPFVIFLGIIFVCVFTGNPIQL